MPIAAPHAPHAATARPYLWMLLAAVAFAGMAAFARTLAPHLDWRLIALVRSGMALVFAVGLVHASGARLVFWRPWTLWMRSLAGSVSMVCTFYALAQKLPLAEVLTISNVFPIWVALLSWPLLGEIPGLSVWLAIVVGLSGVVVLERPQSLDGNAAAAVVLLGSVFTAIAMLGLHRLQHLSARAVVAHFSGVAMLTCGTLVLCNLPTVAARSQFSVSVVFLLLGLGVCATVGQIFLTKAFAAGPPAKVSVVALTQVAFALALDMVFWRHRFDGWDLAGIALVVAPTIWLLVSRPAIAGPRPDID
ncbi:MAG: DMT family transporter [Planctomycetaceae bacterium]|nr:DMT family transporter [Planctomycetaceae bacterium]